MVEAYLKVLDLAYYEAKFAFEGMADATVWKRPVKGLLSVGELAGHIAYWEANKFAGEGKYGEMEADAAKCRVKSPLVDPRFRYYPATIADPPSAQHLAMTAEQVWAELLRVHEESMAHFKALNPEPESHPPGWPAYYTYEEFLKYAVFHASYHVGQMYTARHLLGDVPPDN